jgi:anti-sigma B factor antagonist
MSLTDAVRRGLRDAAPRSELPGPRPNEGSRWMGEQRERVDDLLRCSYEHDGGADIVHVRGELDISSVGELQCAVAGAPCKGRELHLDLSGLTFLDSTGAEALMRIHKSFETDGRRVVLTRPRRQVLTVLTLLGLDQLLSIKP